MEEIEIAGQVMDLLGKSIDVSSSASKRQFERFRHHEVMRRSLRKEIQEKEDNLTDLEHAFMMIDESATVHAMMEKVLGRQGFATDHLLSEFGECKDPSYINLQSAVETPDGFLNFTHAYPGSDEARKVTKIFVRKCYRGIFSQLKIPSEKEKSYLNQYLIQGTPGIGKSIFLIYAFWRLVMMRRAVMFVSSDDKIYFDGSQFWDYRGNVFEKHQKDPAGRILWNRDLFCLFDADNAHAIPNVYRRCQFIVSTWPKRDLINDYQKLVDEDNQFYMPVWSIEEMERIKDLYRAEPSWTKLFDLVGGIPRNVFDKPHKLEKSLSKLEAAVRDSKFEVLKNLTTVKMVHLSNNQKSFIHQLVHIHSDPPFTAASMTFASPLVLRLVFDHHLDSIKAKWGELLHQSVSDSLEGVMMGNLFQKIALDILSTGGTFIYCELRYGRARIEKGKLTIQAGGIQWARKVELSGEPGVLYVPISPTYPGIDAWIYDVGGVQITVNLLHSMKDSLLTDLPRLGDGKDKLFWVLRPREYKVFKARNNESETFSYPKLKQYAIELPDALLCMVDRALERMKEHQLAQAIEEE